MEEPKPMHFKEAGRILDAGLIINFKHRRLETRRVVL